MDSGGVRRPFEREGVAVAFRPAKVVGEEWLEVAPELDREPRVGDHGEQEDREDVHQPGHQTGSGSSQHEAVRTRRRHREWKAHRPLPWCARCRLASTGGPGPSGARLPGLGPTSARTARAGRGGAPVRPGAGAAGHGRGVASGVGAAVSDGAVATLAAGGVFTCGGPAGGVASAGIASPIQPSPSHHRWVAGSAGSLYQPGAIAFTPRA